MQRKRLLAEEYKRELVAQLEERRQKREQEKTVRVEEDRRAQQRFRKEAPAKRQEVRPQTSEAPQTTMSTSHNHRRVSVSRADRSQVSNLGSDEAEMQQKKHLQAEEYKRELVAQIEEQRRRREEEKAAQLEEEREVTREQQRRVKLQQGKRQEVLNTNKREQTQASGGVTQKHRYVHHNLWGPVEADNTLKKHLKEEEYKRGLQAQIEEQRQRREKEKEAQMAEDQTDERRFKREKGVNPWRFPQDTLGRRHEVKVDTHASMDFSQSSKYAHNLSCLLDPAQRDLMQSRRVRDEEHRNELDMQVTDQRHRRAQEKEVQQAREVAEEQAEERRLKREDEFKLQKLRHEQKKRELEAQMEEQRQLLEKELRLARQQESKQSKYQQDARRKGRQPNRRAEQLDRTQCDTAPQQLPLVTRKNEDVSRQSHSTEYVSLKVCNSWDMLGYRVVTVHTKDASSQTDPHDGVIPRLERVVRPSSPHTDHTDDRSRQQSPPVPAVQRWLQHRSAHPDPPPSEGAPEAAQGCPADCREASAQSTPLGAQLGGLKHRHPPSPPPAQDSLKNVHHTKHDISSELHQVFQEQQEELDTDS
ncbi:hypothetical protein SKAU_G00012830 [Synaphobranchus kaupii]|uniref:Uncharacterized protein n=1 Tax=Synaphobranchus kaupii TaxID=118154 RepID=A0A9Q1JD50_SYNKA|nr:hypothetical protein SKAU_G00012830 [Synaphobranchus kaupii]